MVVGQVFMLGTLIILDSTVTIWGRKGSKHLAQLKETHKNEYLTLPTYIHFTDDLAIALKFSDTIIISISSQQLRNLLQDIKKYNFIQNKTFILCMKGLEITTGKRHPKVSVKNLAILTLVYGSVLVMFKIFCVVSRLYGYFR